MFTVKKVGETKARLKRFTITDEEGNETVVNVSDNIHYVVAFVNTGAEQEKGFPAEICVGGETIHLGELYYQLGNLHPELIRHCVRRSTEKMAAKIVDEIKRSGVDPIAEALKKMPTPETGKGWN